MSEKLKNKFKRNVEAIIRSSCSTIENGWWHENRSCKYLLSYAIWRWAYKDNLKWLFWPDWCIRDLAAFRFSIEVCAYIDGYELIRKNRSTRGSGLVGISGNQSARNSWTQASVLHTQNSCRFIQINLALSSV